MSLHNLSRLQLHAIKSAVLTLVCATALFQYPLEHHFSALQKLSNSINSLKLIYFAPETPNSEVVIVGIDDKALNDFGRWPWPRSLQANLFSGISESRILALDILYLEENIEDPVFSKQLKDMPQIIGALASLPDSASASQRMYDALSPFMIDDIIHKKSATSDSNYILMPELHHLSEIPPKLLPAFARSGLVHINHSSLNQQLNYMPGMIDDKHGLVIPSLGLQVLQSRFDNKFTIETGTSNRIFFNKLNTPELHLNAYSGIPLNYYKNSPKIVSAADVLNGDIPPDFFLNKIVFAGFTATGLHDTFITPLGPIKGVEFHTTLVSNFLNNELVQQFHWSEKALFLILAVFAWVIILLQPLSYFRRFILLTFGISLIFSVDFILFNSFNIWTNSYFLVSFFFISVSLNEIIWNIDQEFSSGELKRAFQSYLSEDLLDVIRQNPEQVQLGGLRQEATFLFSDIRNFSRLSEELEGEDLVDTLNRYFTPMTKSILEHKGMLDKYIGDAVMAIFNAPITVPNHPLEACLCALDMSEKLGQFNIEQNINNRPKLEIGIGINSGEALVGNMGSDLRFNYTAMGDVVNTASRIESITKVYKCEILIGEETWLSIRSHLLTRYIDTVILKGKDLPAQIYQILPKTGHNREMCKDFGEARALYQKGQMQEALLAFQSCEKKWKDSTSAVFAIRCEQWLANGLPEKWEDFYNLNKT